jgi:2-desacetyl-2-hydroxyethyl bacteriochlorophyllide A dehydrogenase
MPSEHARAFWITGPGQGEVRQRPLPAPAAGEVLIESLFSGISRGTELLVYRNEVPASEVERMRCPFQEGRFPSPVKYGYALVGRVAAGPADLVGHTVFVLHPHQDRIVVPAAAVVPVPDRVPAARAVLAANMETALNGVWDGDIAIGERVCVVGGGVVGLLIARLCSRIPGVTVDLVDPDPGKIAPATALGLRCSTAVPPSGDYDRVFHASGAPDGLATALAVAGFEAVIVEMSWFGTKPVTLPLGEAFHARRLAIVSSQVGSVAARRRSRWTHRRRLEAALALLDDDRLDALISGESSFEHLPEAMAALADGRLAALCHRVRY